MALYQTVQPLLPALLPPDAQVVVTDIDNDEFSEVIVLNSDVAQLAVVHRFTFAQLSSADWGSDNTAHWWNLWVTTPQGAIPGGWTVQTGDKMLAADFDGDGVDELFLYNTFTFKWCIAEWMTGGLQVIYQSSSGCADWQIQTGDEYFVFPHPNGQTAAGILAFNKDNRSLGVLLYDATAKAISCPYASPGGNIDGWQFDKDSRFTAGDLVTALTGAFVVFNPKAGYIACLTWNGTAFSVSSGQHGSLGTAPQGQGTWAIGSDDQYQCADLDGDGTDEIFVYDWNDKFLGAWKWIPASSQFQCLVSTKSVDGFTIGSQDQYLCQSGKPGASLIAFGQSVHPPLLGILTYASSVGFTFQSNDAPSGPWAVTQSDRYYSVALTSQAQPKLFVISPQINMPGAAPARTLGAIEISGASLTVSSSVALPVPGWTPTLLAQAPATKFPQFPAGDESAIYAYISNLFPEPTQGNIRDYYTSSNWANKFQPFYETLQGMPNPPTGQTWSANINAWQTVRQTIMDECNYVDTVIATYAAIRDMAEDADIQQNSDLVQVKHNIQITPSSESSFEYWGSQVTVGVVWGLAAVTGLLPELAAAMGAFVSMSASLLGSALSFSSPRSPISYQEIADLITEAFGNSAITNSQAPAEILTDPVKLRILDELSGTTWQMRVDDWSSVAASVSAANRITMYQLLMPYVFKVGAVTNAKQAEPYFQVLTWGTHTIWVPFGNDNDFYISDPIENNLFNDYVLYYEGTGPYTYNPNTAPQVLQDDLISLGAKTNLLMGAGLWSAIPRTFFPGGLGPK